MITGQTTTELTRAESTMAELTMAGLTMAGLSNRPTDGHLAIQPLLCAPDLVEQISGSASAVAPVETSVFPSTCASAESWRVEVAARLERYRTRRKPRTPRYPSLLLPFDAPLSWSRSAPPPKAAETGSRETESVEPSTAAGDGQDFSFEAKVGRVTLAEVTFAEPRPGAESAKVIEFPRSAAIPVSHPSDLADPVVDRDRPRIVEAPEILPPPPALGGMLIEPAHRELADPRIGFPAAVNSASIARRLLAALVDGVIVATALTGCAAIFLRVNPSIRPIHAAIPLLAEATRAATTLSGAARATLAAATLTAAAVAFLLWAAYEFCFVVYTGSTPGLRAARLRLAGFNGSPLHRRARRWRVLASLLSAFSAGLGYLWCVLDQDGLCWHDRITRTCVQAAAPPE